MSREKVKCVFCDTVKTEKLHIFSEEAMAKCQKILRLRKMHNLKYNNIILSGEIFDCGYHSSYYKAFTALKKNFFLQMSLKKFYYNLVLLRQRLNNHRHQLLVLQLMKQ